MQNGHYFAKFLNKNNNGPCPCIIVEDNDGLQVYQFVALVSAPSSSPPWQPGFLNSGFRIMRRMVLGILSLNDGLYLVCDNHVLNTAL